MYARHHLDLRWRDLAYGMRQCLRPVDGAAAERAALRRCGIPDDGLVTLSVRSAWDLLLTALDWPPGSEVLVSALGHPGMVTILADHGLRAVPVDLDPVTLAPDLDDLRAALTPRTRGLLLVQLFGGRIPLPPYAAFAHEHGLLLVEDAAQAFAGPGEADPPGSAGAAVTLYSFGLIKTATAVGGAVAVVREDDLLTRMRGLHREWPPQPALEYASRLLRVAGMLVLGRPPVLEVFFVLSRLTGRDPDAAINTITRSYGGSTSRMLRAIRRRPAPALVAVLVHRLAHFDQVRLARRAALGERVRTRLGGDHPGTGLTRRTHWVVPVLAEQPAALVHRLRAAGLDASGVTTNLTVTPAADGTVPTRVAALLDRIVFLPVYPELPERALDRLVAVVGERAGSTRVANAPH